jgi:hypothetical protein
MTINWNKFVCVRSLFWIGLFTFTISLAFFTYWQMLYAKPFVADNIIIFSIFETKSLREILLGQPVSFLPAYRPAPYFSTYLQYQLVGVQGTSYYAVNIVINALMAFVGGALFYRVTTSKLFAFIFAAAIISDTRSFDSMLYIIERQSTMAVLFGGLVIYCLSRSQTNQISIHNAAAISALLCFLH